MNTRPALAATALATVSLAMLAGCASAPAPDPTAEAPHCYKTNRGRPVVCTTVVAPSLNADAQAKRFEPDARSLTVFVVRKNWGDTRHLISLFVDGRAPIETVPESLVRLRLKPGQHSLSFEFEGQRQELGVSGGAGEVRFVRIEGSVWAWGSNYGWASEQAADARARALNARLVADIRLD